MWTLIVLLVGIGGNIAPWVYILGGNKYPDYKQEEMWMLMGENVTGRKYDATPVKLWKIINHCKKDGLISSA